MYLYNVCKINSHCQCFEKDGSRISIDTRIDVISQVTSFSVDECKKKVKNTKPKDVQPDLCPNPKSFFTSSPLEIKKLKEELAELKLILKSF